MAQIYKSRIFALLFGPATLFSYRQKTIKLLQDSVCLKMFNKKNSFNSTRSQLLNFVPGSYMDRTSRPIYALMYLLGFIIIYEVGTIMTNPEVLDQALGQTRIVVSFVWVQTLLGLLGFSHRMTWVAAPLALVIILLALQFTSRTQWSVRPADFIPMTIECILLAVPLVVLSILLNRPAPAPTEAAWDIGQFPQTVYLAAESANAPADNNTSRPADALLRTDGTVPGLMPNIVTGIGAGIYEELIFRLILIYLLMFFFQDLLKFSKAHSLVLSVLIAAILFSAHHHIFYIYGQLRSGEPFTMVKFIFRTLAGIYFAALFAIRGFAVTAGAHVFYNIIAAVLNSIGSA